ncbi:DNA polymerase III subunit alpha [Pseudoalteromonas sp. OFAV1]|uniref:DNA polymerase III subunit alpha n=1 Tax=Pseudoalteromonas sp. OFAV1 TaxID=2908892 RepID=UPI001F1690FB|nr:DNA polymerase III subunit alpha [Pseudoalteromonas sp. OFAV1]MCF2901831.1 DNA polymerase III subunit alpha [Pseudoalteromonas sp. OFAV1]
MSFIHLRLHTDYSLNDSILNVKHLTESKEHKCFAITDDNNLFGAIKFYSGSRKSSKKPIIGSEINVTTPYGQDTLVLLSKSNSGYKNLMKLISIGFEGKEHKDSEPTVPWEELRKYSGDLFALSGGNNSLLQQLILEKDRKALSYVDECNSIFSAGYFIELQRLGFDYENQYIESAVKIASAKDIPVVATNNVRFLHKEDYETHEIREAIAEGNKLFYLRQNSNKYSPEQYLKTSEQMESLFADIPSAISNTDYIARSCNVEIELGKEYLPDFPVADGHVASTYLVEKARTGLETRLKQLFPDDTLRKQKAPEYEERLEYELTQINNMGFPGYFLIVMEFVQWCKENDIPVGPGRGSGAGSLVAYALQITDLDPIEFGLIFERFLNPERVSMPDFDIDFCTHGRERVIQHVAELYGKDAVSQIVTFGTMAAKMVIKDVARALDHPYMFGDSLSKLIPNKPGIKLQEAIDQVPALRMRMDDDPQVAEVMKHALKLEGTVRQVGKHAGGVLISPSTIYDFSPIYKESADSPPVSQFDKNDVESVGLVKFDFLGLKTMTVVQDAIKLARGRGYPDFTIYDIPIDDPDTYKVILDANTTGVFQLESAGMKSLIKRLEPSNFEEVIALVALFRPGPLDSGMVDTYINCKKGIEEVHYPDPLLEPVLDVTYGVFVYQEQVMKAAQVMGGYSLGQADLLRKAMGKKLPEEMAKQRKMFVEGSVKNGLDADHAGKVFNLMETFAGYGFNKSHSAAYALISVITAYLKSHHTVEFFTSVMSHDSGKVEKLVGDINDAKANGVNVVSPDINKSDTKFSILNDNQILFGLDAIKGVGESVQENIIRSRNEDGPFKDMFDFMIRVNPTKTVTQALIYSGAFDNLGTPREFLHRVFIAANDLFKSYKEDRKKNVLKANSNPQMAFLEAEANIKMYMEKWEQLVSGNEPTKLSPPITPSELIIEERKRLGFYLSSHPMKPYENEVSAIGASKLSDFNEIDGNTILENKKNGGQGNAHTIIGAVTDIVVSHNKKGHSAQITVDDGTSQVKLRLQNRLYSTVHHLLEKDNVLCFKVGISYNPQSERKYINVYECDDISQLRQRLTKEVIINIDLENPIKKQKLKNELSSMSIGAYKLLVNNTSKPDEAPMRIRNGRLLSEQSIENIRAICETDDAIEFIFNTENGVTKDVGINMDEVDEDLLHEELKSLDKALKRAAATMGMALT